MIDGHEPVMLAPLIFWLVLFAVASGMFELKRWARVTFVLVSVLMVIALIRDLLGV
jgi:hypothetical protein